ncbi:ATP-binding cassette domain-containing protein [Brumimicrobium salinarum]|uniref:ATP-binding cassette domain-containing protein n=1 Tax=Brumimicrobium salinarum TaxID=2058658 RepID=UPI0013FE1654|nr:ABC transporter ATP-binding protein [Brumimicrobium salinarum]
MSLKLKHIGFNYALSKPVFKGVELEVSPGEICSIVGPSGTGKSTLLKCMAGQLQISQGEILIDGHKLLGPQEKLVAGHPEIALVNQNFEQDEYFTVSENIANQLHHLNRQDRLSFVQELLTIFELNSVSNKKSKKISGGEKQRLSMACALAKEPKYLLLDEPFVHFDVHLHRKIGTYLKELAKIREMGVVLVTHNGAEALSWSNRILMMYKGNIQRSYTPEMAYYKPKTLFEGRFFGDLNSVYIQEKQYLFRPNEYSLVPENNKLAVSVTFRKSQFNGPFIENYFQLKNKNEIVLYASTELKEIKEIYV